MYECFILFGLLMDKFGNGGKGILWNIQDEIDFFGKFNYIKCDGLVQGCLLIDIVIDVLEVILVLVLEINGYVVVKVWQVLGEIIGCEYIYLVLYKEDEKICFCDIQVQLCKIIFSFIWFGLESDYVFYNVGYINVYELILWCMLLGCQQFYQDYLWMCVFGESLVVYCLFIDICSVSEMCQILLNGFLEKVFNFLMLYQKWGIYLIYSENLLMLMFFCGGLIVWISEIDV